MLSTKARMTIGILLPVKRILFNIAVENDLVQEVSKTFKIELEVSSCVVSSIGCLFNSLCFSFFSFTISGIKEVPTPPYCIFVWLSYKAEKASQVRSNFESCSTLFVPSTSFIQRKVILKYAEKYNDSSLNYIIDEQDTGNGNKVEVFDRNRLYLAMGYMIKNGLKIQFGIMRQTTDNWSKNQLQISLHQTF